MLGYTKFCVSNEISLILVNASWETNNETFAKTLFLVLYPDKCQFICSFNDTVNLTVENQIIDNGKCEKLLGVKFDYKLTFNAHVDVICKKAEIKLNALSRIAPYMDFNKKRLLVNAFFMSQFNYCPLIKMCNDRTKNNKIHRILERWIRLIYNDKKSSFENLLDKYKSVSMHHKNLSSLVIEMFKTHGGVSSEILNDLFPLRQADQYNLRKRSQFIIPNVKTVNHVFLRYLGPKIWDSLKNFKNAIEKWKPESCSCRLAKYIFKT